MFGQHTHDEYSDKARGDDDPVSLTVVSSLAHKYTVEDEVTKTKLEPSSCVCVCVGGGGGGEDTGP